MCHHLSWRACRTSSFLIHDELLGSVVWIGITRANGSDRAMRAPYALQANKIEITVDPKRVSQIVVVTYVRQTERNRRIEALTRRGAFGVSVWGVQELAQAVGAKCDAPQLAAEFR